jgi:hypothetical protein
MDHLVQTKRRDSHLASLNKKGHQQMSFFIGSGYLIQFANEKTRRNYIIGLVSQQFVYAKFTNSVGNSHPIPRIPYSLRSIYISRLISAY